ncbi:MAG: hypothetical protein H6736_09500 [Alphaproteobacteria bacterium]|nr:hypothetical protein [Alphaproteobacteria bacterium]MCB9692036.1 hypothetical protein [Alphaproteobacteria bacterium]
MSILEELRTHARDLHVALVGGDHDLLDYVNRGARQRVGPDDVQRRHVLAGIARHLGFRGWSHLTAVAALDEDDHGELYVPRKAGGFTNVWSATWEEAADIRAANDGWLLPWRRQFVVVTPAFVEDVLGIDPAHEDGLRTGHDLARPQDTAARDRLFATTVRHRLG